MAKRKRLTPAEITAPETKAALPLGVQAMTTRRPPIAQVAGDAAAQAALEEVTDELQAARNGGRMVLELPLEAVDETYLVRDRMVAAEDELDVLMQSLAARGQQTPIEVVQLGQGRYGLISGWRRLTALRRLDGQGTVQALLRRPETAADAYLAMVEENEIRVGLSYYERARIVARAAEQGVYRDPAAALKGLFASASRSKRSKIGSFLKLYSILDDRLQFPSAISERQGLALVKLLEADPEAGTRLRDRLRKTIAETAADEVAALEKILRGNAEKQSLTGELDTKLKAKPAPEESLEVASGIYLKMGQGRLVLSGKRVDAKLCQDLTAWLSRR